MQFRIGLRAALIAAALSVMFCANGAHGGVTSVSGEAQVLVTQYNGAQPVQSDFSIENVPLTRPEPPAIAKARVDRLLTSNEVIAAGQGVAIMYAPNLSGFGNPNDVGIDIGGFTDGADQSTRWVTNASVRQTRSLLVSPGEIGLQAGTSAALIRNRLLLSGIMVVTSEDVSRNLTGVNVHFAFSIVRRQDGRETSTPLAGQIKLVGGPGGSVEVQDRSGALGDVVIPIIDLNAAIPSAPLVKAIVFAGTEFTYEYDVSLNQPFELELSVTAAVETLPGGVGALATFGTPAEGLGAIFDRVKKDDSGPRLLAAIDEKVDTTGAAYVKNTASFPGLMPMCGSMGGSLMGMMLVGGWMFTARHGRRTAKPRLRIPHSSQSITRVG